MGCRSVPVGYSPCVARLIKGLFGSLLSLAPISSKSLGLNVGCDAITKISPLCAFSRMTAPRWSFIISSARHCKEQIDAEAYIQPLRRHAVQQMIPPNRCSRVASQPAQILIQRSLQSRLSIDWMVIAGDRCQVGILVDTRSNLPVVPSVASMMLFVRSSSMPAGT